MIDTESEDYPAERFGQTLRRTTKLELGLAGGMAMVLVAVVAFGITLRETVDDMKSDLEDALIDLRVIKQQAPDLAVLRYRVEQLELERDRATRARR
jgi:hypothetical protein